MAWISAKTLNLGGKSGYGPSQVCTHGSTFLFQRIPATHKNVQNQKPSESLTATAILKQELQILQRILHGPSHNNKNELFDCEKRVFNVLFLPSDWLFYILTINWNGFDVWGHDIQYTPHRLTQSMTSTMILSNLGGGGRVRSVLLQYNIST